MPTAREIFLAQVRTPDLDTEVFELRKSLTTLKREALAQVAAVDEARARMVMPGLYEQMVQLEVHLAGHVGLGVAFALSVLDEHHSSASLSRVDRELRESMSEVGATLATRQGSRLARMVAQIESQRLVWRHSHEFMSWLAFRRGDERYPAKDRLERLDAFGVQQRLLEARTVVLRSSACACRRASKPPIASTSAIAGGWRPRPSTRSSATCGRSCRTCPRRS
jgi:hypothetical protein